MNTRVAEGACSHLTRPLCLNRPLCFRCNHQYGGGVGRFRSKQDRKIQNNSINILPIVIREKEQHSRLNTRPYVREI